MKANLYYGEGDVRVEEVPDPVVEHSTDAIVRVKRSCICGSDLWYYRGVASFNYRHSLGHEFSEPVSKLLSADCKDASRLSRS